MNISPLPIFSGHVSARISADSDKADLYIGYQTAVNQEMQWDAWGSILRHGHGIVD